MASRRTDPPQLLSSETTTGNTVVKVRRIHRRDLNRVWEFLKLVFRDVNRETVEYQRPRSKIRFLEVYEEEGVEQLGGGEVTARPKTHLPHRLKRRKSFAESFAACI